MCVWRSLQAVLSESFSISSSLHISYNSLHLSFQRSFLTVSLPSSVFISTLMASSFPNASNLAVLSTTSYFFKSSICCLCCFWIWSSLVSKLKSTFSRVSILFLRSFNSFRILFKSKLSKISKSYILDSSSVICLDLFFLYCSSLNFWLFKCSNWEYNFSISLS